MPPLYAGFLPEFYLDQASFVICGGIINIIHIKICV
jgi:hypothetical protein